MSHHEVGGGTAAETMGKGSSKIPSSQKELAETSVDSAYEDVNTPCPSPEASSNATAQQASSIQAAPPCSQEPTVPTSDSRVSHAERESTSGADEAAKEEIEIMKSSAHANGILKITESSAHEVKPENPVESQETNTNEVNLEQPLGIEGTKAIGVESVTVPEAADKTADESEAASESTDAITEHSPKVTQAVSETEVIKTDCLKTTELCDGQTAKSLAIVSPTSDTSNGPVTLNKVSDTSPPAAENQDKERDISEVEVASDSKASTEISKDPEPKGNAKDSLKETELGNGESETTSENVSTSTPNTSNVPNMQHQASDINTNGSESRENLPMETVFEKLRQGTNDKVSETNIINNARSNFNASGNATVAADHYFMLSSTRGLIPDDHGNSNESNNGEGNSSTRGTTKSSNNQVSSETANTKHNETAPKEQRQHVRRGRGRHALKKASPGPARSRRHDVLSALEPYTKEGKRWTPWKPGKVIHWKKGHPEWEKRFGKFSCACCRSDWASTRTFIDRISGKVRHQDCKRCGFPSLPYEMSLIKCKNCSKTIAECACSAKSSPEKSLSSGN